MVPPPAGIARHAVIACIAQCCGCHWLRIYARMCVCRMAPSKDCFVQASHALVICRPTSISSHAYVPLAAAPSKAELKLQEALATWVGPHGRSMHGGDWQLETTPVSTFDATTVAAQRAAAAAAVSGNSNDAPLHGNPHWSSSVSQVDLLRRQVEASSMYGAGQPSIGSLEGAAPSPQPLEAQDVPANNIVPAPQLGSTRAAAGHDTMQLSMVAAAAAAAPMNMQLNSGSGAAPMSRELALSGQVAAAPGGSSSSINAVFGPVAAQQSSSSGNAAVLGRLSVAPAGPIGSSSNSSSTGGGSSSSSTSASRGTSVALRTADWPVLSGAHDKGCSKPLWRVQPSNKPKCPRLNQQHVQRRRLSALIEESVGGYSRFAADSCGEVELKPSRVLQVLQGPTASRAGGLNDAAVLVPPEYFEVGITCAAQHLLWRSTSCNQQDSGLLCNSNHYRSYEQPTAWCNVSYLG